MWNYAKINPTMQWSPNAEGDLSGYTIHYRRDDQTSFTNVDIGLLTTYTMTGLGPYQRWYYFSISAFDTTGNRSDRTSELRFYISDPSTRETTSKVVVRKGL